MKILPKTEKLKGKLDKTKIFKILEVFKLLASY